MGKGRMEAFSDGVIAIIITIMVLELRVPHETEWPALVPLIPVFLSYVLSFVFVGIYWNNHHHLLHAVKSVSGPVLWANLFLLFWLSLMPFATAWLGENHLATIPAALYGIVLLMSGVAFTILVHFLVKHEGSDSTLARAVGKNRKTQISVVFDLLGIGIAFFDPRLSVACYVIVALIWFIPDRRIERAMGVE
jgi:uncharacterized membrane protein